MIMKFRLWQEDDELMYECSCPVGQDGDFCKHCVATGLALLAKRLGKKQHSAMDDIRDYLETLEADALRGIITHACKHDKRFRERLLLVARGRGNSKSAVKAWKDALNRATEIFTRCDTA